LTLRNHGVLSKGTGNLGLGSGESGNGGNGDRDGRAGDYGDVYLPPMSFAIRVKVDFLLQNFGVLRQSPGIWLWKTRQLLLVALA
jgi:hypothetical protein